MEKIFVIDDDLDMCLLLSRFLIRHGYEVETANSGKKALEYLKNNKPSLILCDFKLNDRTGTELLLKTKEIYPDLPFIIITGYGDVKDAVEIMKLGATDYITKPLFPDEILLVINKILKDDAPKINAFEKKEALAGIGKIKPIYNENFIVGSTSEFNTLLKQMELVAPTNFTVIIYGESGTGKEVIAQQIHLRSSRAKKPFVAIDCGVLSKELAGSEFFGHEKGAFTGAISQKIGSFEVANGGTIFLDEIANLPYDVQIALLRFVEERKIRRLGGTKDIELDLRIIVASNEKLWDIARSGKFREDLFHRFNEFSIDVPPLRNRKNDILLFANHFLKITNKELGKNVSGFTAEVEDILINYTWYGNLRELKNVIKRATLLTDTHEIEAKYLPFEINNYKKLQFETPVIENTIQQNIPRIIPSQETNFEHKLKIANADAEFNIILEALRATNYNKSKTAQLLNIDRKTLYNKLKSHKNISTE